MLLPLRPEVEAAFAAALELPASEQPSFLIREYPNDPALRAEVEALLRTYQAAGSFLEPSAGSQRPTFAEATSFLPTAIGCYRIRRLVGQGAMGAVYEATQEHPRRTVALKVIKPGLADRELLRRFELESQALGRLQHPGIAQIYEVDTWDCGFGPQPYFAMEFISGNSLIAHANARQLTTRQRLEIMARVCEAVHHAHQRGIIHRDLKPDNILVDGSSQPKILDFGVARMTDADAYASRQSDVGHLIGTLAYMSPEQVLADPLGLDTRSDVYSLGVILFELLAGRLPYNITRHVPQAVQTIREQEPATLGSVDRAFRGDIETIVSKALEKDKTRRYSSAADLAADIRHYLADEPILAHPPSASYHLRKFARRHKTLIAGAAAVFVVLITGIVVSTLEAARARHAEQMANAVNEFLQNDLLAQASAGVQARPGSRPDPDLKVRTALDRAAARLAAKFSSQPLVEASLRQTIGSAYRDLGLLPEAQQQLERALNLRRAALGEKNRNTLATVKLLAAVYASQGKYAKAEPLYTLGVDVARRLLGEENPDTLGIMTDFAVLYRYQGKYAQAIPLQAKVLEVQRRVLGARHQDTLTSMNNLALFYSDVAKYDAAKPLLVEAINLQRSVLGEEHPDTLSSMHNLAPVHSNEGNYKESAALYEKVVEIKLRVLGEQHPSTLLSMSNLAVAYRNLGDLERAQALYMRVLSTQRRVLGEEHPDTVRTMNNLGVLYRNRGRYTDAESILRKTLEVRKLLLGEEHSDTLVSMHNLASVYRDAEKYAQAEPLFTRTIELRRRVLGEENPNTLLSMANLASLYRNQGRYEEAEQLYARVFEVRRRVLGPEHLDTTTMASALGQIRLAQQRYVEAETLLREAWNGQRNKNPEAWQRFETESLLGQSLARQRRFSEAAPLLIAGYQGLRRQKSTIPWDGRHAVEQAAERLAQFYRSLGRPRSRSATPPEQ